MSRRIVAGIDVGTENTKAVILVDGEPCGAAEVKTVVPKSSASQALTDALAAASLKLEDVQYTIATGRGRSQVSFAAKTLTEITCASKGAVHTRGPGIRTVLDVGGQSCRVIHCTEEGKAAAFLWNDKCAAGIGRSLETFASLIGLDLAETARISLDTKQSPNISDFCAVYAQSEALDLVRSKVPPEQIVAGYYQAMASRIATLVNRQGLKNDVAIVGGVARNPGMVSIIQRLLGTDTLGQSASDPMFTVAFGAAIWADAEVGRTPKM